MLIRGGLERDARQCSIPKKTVVDEMKQVFKTRKPGNPKNARRHKTIVFQWILVIDNPRVCAWDTKSKGGKGKSDRIGAVSFNSLVRTASSFTKPTGSKKLKEEVRWRGGEPRSPVGGLRGQEDGYLGWNAVTTFNGTYHREVPLVAGQQVPDWILEPFAKGVSFAVASGAHVPDTTLRGANPGEMWDMCFAFVVNVNFVLEHHVDRNFSVLALVRAKVSVRALT
ncbi:hypothetical protein SODALDRAFT_381806 [Sodiomyces alkalinus F11]|uniref:Uncharacterized protein n=1 Tax=Sodiomyces alkalinus (strain CBS 110278 / VKM F-3762 / F11) TaxID=1314773 RepID=A0A3N2PMA2_SODAK|nr:hypothetical protein SODALDRAFT_381806 [Sodiomyces alkalinus F11]ROT35657.1 hypothetical protein SODALDRAFT_381806 [Sodiomyces alkalinus F11]